MRLETEAREQELEQECDDLRKQVSANEESYKAQFSERERLIEELSI